MDSTLPIVTLLFLCFPLCILLNIYILWNWRANLPLILLYLAYILVQKEPMRIRLPGMNKVREYFPASLHGALLEGEQRVIYVCYPHGKT